MRRMHKLGFSLTLLLPITALLLAFPDGPFPRLTGGFGEDTCLSCHDAQPLNFGRSLGGTFQIDGVPENYVPGQAYDLRVAISHPGQSRWGFELSARVAEDGRQAGLLEPVDPLTQVKRARNIEYIEHTESGSQNGSTGTVEFRFRWTAPDPALGPVLFNASGNAADADGSTAGDYIYTAGAYSGGPGLPATSQLPVSSEAPPQSRRISNDSRVAHMPAPVDLDRGNVEVIIQHRFLGPFLGRDGTPDAGTAFGVDFGANINLEVAYALTDRLSVGVSRARFNQIVSLSGTYEIHTDADSPWKLSLRGGAEGQRNFQQHYSPFLEVPAQFDHKFFRAHVTPVFAFNSRNDRLAQLRGDGVNPDSNHTFALGLGTDLALNRRLSLVGEWVPRISGFGGFGGDRSAVSGGLKIRTFGHVFHILLSTSRVFTPAQYGVNSTSTDYALGFNIYRRVAR